MDQFKSCDLNHLVSLAADVVEEVRTQELQADLDGLLTRTNRDPSCIYKRKKRYPRAVVWELTLACNMRCGHCGSSAGSGRPDELTPEQALRLCEELGALGTERLTLLGGEPLIHPFWEDLTACLQENGVRVNLITNGWKLDDPRFCDRIAEAGFTIVGISVDGLKRSHDTLRRAGSFNRISRGMDLLRARNVPVAAVTVVTRESIEELEDLYEFLLAKGTKVWQLQLAAPLGRLNPEDPRLIQPRQIRRVFDFLRMKNSGHGLLTIDLADNVGYFPPGGEDCIRSTRKTNKNWIGCMAGIQVLGIDSNGDIKGCQSLPSIPEFVEGNVKTTPLKEIWENPDNFSYNRKFERAELRGFCADCRYGTLCRGGCSSTAYAYTGSTADNPMCAHRAAVETTAPEPTTFDQLASEGRRLIEDKEYKRALRLYEKAAEIRPQDRRTLDTLGFLCYMTGSYEEAAGCCERSLEIEPGNPYALRGLGLCLVEMGRSREGITLIRRAIRIDPECFDAHFDLAVVFAKTGKHGPARKHANKAVAIDSSRSREVDRLLARLVPSASPRS